MKKYQKKAIVLGGSGFIGGYLITRLKKEDYHVTSIDIKKPEFKKTDADVFILHDLRKSLPDLKCDEIYQLAADMGGAGYVFSGDHDADIMINSAKINLNVANWIKDNKKTKLFFSSSACVYSNMPTCPEKSAYPAMPHNEYGWEKLFSERLYQSLAKNYGVEIRIARFHNTYGPYSVFEGGKEKAPLAICRKVLQEKKEIEIWGNGKQTRSFTYIDDCIEGIRRLMNSNVKEVLNLGSDELVTIDELAKKIMKIANKKLKIKHIPGAVGVFGRNSDNKLIKENLNWEPKISLEEGLQKTFDWLKSIL